jgi:hypothetical protein
MRELAMQRRTYFEYQGRIEKDESWKKKLVFDSTFEAIFLFSLLGLVLSAAFFFYHSPHIGG